MLKKLSDHSVPPFSYQTQTHLAVRNSQSRLVYTALSGPHSLAKAKFFEVTVTRSQAIGMVARDPDFIAEADLDTTSRWDYPVEAARRLVEEVWLPQLVENMSRGRV